VLLCLRLVREIEVKEEETVKRDSEQSNEKEERERERKSKMIHLFFYFLFKFFSHRNSFSYFLKNIQMFHSRI